MRFQVSTSLLIPGLRMMMWVQYPKWTSFTNGATLTKNSGDGDWYLHIRAIDNANNANYSVSSNFRLDNTAPAHAWIQKPLNADTGDTVVIELNATDVSSVSECIITVDGEEHQMNTSSGGYSWTVDIPASDSGTLVSQIIYSCTLSDLLGNVGSTGNVRNECFYPAHCRFHSRCNQRYCSANSKFRG
jgi:hypothetical protein